MIKPLRRVHLQIWIVLALLIPLGIVSGVLVRPEPPNDKLLQPVSTEALPAILASIDKDTYNVCIRSNKDTSQLQLEWINKKSFTYPTATIYQDTTGTSDISRAILIGRIEARGTYRFELNKKLTRDRNNNFIVYDFIHQKIIDSINF